MMTTEVIGSSDLIIFAIPINSYKSIPVNLLDNKTVIDTTNYNSSINGILEEFENSDLPTSEYLQQYFSGAKFVKSFNNIDYIRLVQLSNQNEIENKAFIPVFSDFDKPKIQVSKFIERIGFDVIDAGSLSESWRSQPGQPIYVTPYLRYKNKNYSDPFEKFANADPILLDKETAENLIFS